jgi:hypothetical protein
VPSTCHCTPSKSHSLKGIHRIRCIPLIPCFLRVVPPLSPPSHAASISHISRTLPWLGLARGVHRARRLGLVHGTLVSRMLSQPCASHLGVVHGTSVSCALARRRVAYIAHCAYCLGLASVTLALHGAPLFHAHLLNPVSRTSHTVPVILALRPVTSESRGAPRPHLRCFNPVSCTLHMASRSHACRLGLSPVTSVSCGTPQCHTRCPNPVSHTLHMASWSHAHSLGLFFLGGAVGYASLPRSIFLLSTRAR